MKKLHYLLLLPLLLTSCLDVDGPSMASTQTISVGETSFRMIFVPSGSFTMGSYGSNAAQGREDEFPAHNVYVSSFYICETEITAAVWNAVMNDSLAGASAKFPAAKVSYTRVMEFISRLNQVTGRTFALPTEAQWEYAARGGADQKPYLYAGSDDIDIVAVYDTTMALPIGQHNANSIALYDMSGNVAEWCQDWYGPYSSSDQNMPTGPTTGTYRVVRGGSYLSSDRDCRVSSRSYAAPDSVSPAIGFRLVLYL